MSSPQAKRRKTIAPRFSTDESPKFTPLPDIFIHRQDPGPPRLDRRVPNEREHSGSKTASAPFEDAMSSATVTPIRSRVLISRDNPTDAPTPAPRMLATPARVRARTIREPVVRPSSENLRSSPSQGAPRPRVQKTASLPRRTTPATPPRSVSRASVTLQSFPAISLEYSDSDSEDSSESNESFKISKPTIARPGSRVPPLGHRAARKTAQAARMAASQVTPETSQVNKVSLFDSDDIVSRGDPEEEDDLYVDDDPVEIPGHVHQHRTEDISNTTKDDGIPNQLEEELNDLLSALTIREARIMANGRFPFLRRNLRKSMDALEPSHWQGHDPEAVRSIDITKVDVHYIWSQYEFSGGSFSGAWFCPLCTTPCQLWFNTRGALDTHLFGYHTECTYEWANNMDNSLLLKILLPDVPDSDSDIEDENDAPDKDDSPSSDNEPVALRNRTPSSDENPFLRGSSVLRAQTILSSSPFRIPPSSPQFTPVRPMKQMAAPAKAPILRPPRPIDPENPERYPTPPPLDDLEGPAAVYPYISEDAYSARPGGPKLYDILNELSLEPFGLMTGYIIDREEDVFELDDMRDEDKVLLALWGRWIFLNRQQFIEDYEKRIKAFIDEYWRIIHRAAGFSALRTWLLVLVQNRYLTGAQFSEALKYYKDLVGMDHWK